MVEENLSRVQPTPLPAVKPAQQFMTFESNQQFQYSHLGSKLHARQLKILSTFGKMKKNSRSPLVRDTDPNIHRIDYDSIISRGRQTHRGTHIGASIEAFNRTSIGFHSGRPSQQAPTSCYSTGVGFYQPQQIKIIDHNYRLRTSGFNRL